MVLESSCVKNIQNTINTDWKLWKIEKSEKLLIFFPFDFVGAIFLYSFVVVALNLFLD